MIVLLCWAITILAIALKVSLSVNDWRGWIMADQIGFGILIGVLSALATMQVASVWWLGFAVSGGFMTISLLIRAIEMMHQENDMYWLDLNFTYGGFAYLAAWSVPYLTKSAAMQVDSGWGYTILSVGVIGVLLCYLQIRQFVYPRPKLETYGYVGFFMLFVSIGAIAQMVAYSFHSKLIEWGAPSLFVVLIASYFVSSSIGGLSEQAKKTLGLIMACSIILLIGSLLTMANLYR